MFPSSRLKMPKYKILTFEDENVMLPLNFGIGLSSDSASYPGRTEIQLHRCNNYITRKIAQVKRFLLVCHFETMY
jgi:hypothetical protein